MRLQPVALSLLLCGFQHAAAQDSGPPDAPSRACVEFNRSILDQVGSGQLKDAEIVLSRALASTFNGLSPSCDWMILQNMAVVMSRSGRLEESEEFADRSVRALEKTVPPGDPSLLRPLHTLASARMQQGKIAGTREAFQRMRGIPLEHPIDRAMFHGTAAALLQTEHRNAEAEAEYITTLAAWEESGRAETADMAAELNNLADLCTTMGRFDQASRMLDRAVAIFSAVVTPARRTESGFSIRERCSRQNKASGGRRKKTCVRRFRLLILKNV
jgi:tetratricopeptide (TPR) repeat protein